MILNEWDESTPIAQSLFIVDEPVVKLVTPAGMFGIIVCINDDPQKVTNNTKIILILFGL